MAVSAIVSPTTILIALNVGLIGLGWYIGTAAIAEPPSAPRRASPAAPPPAPQGSIAPGRPDVPGDVDPVLTRPIFYATRRPFVPPPVAVPPPAAALPVAPEPSPTLGGIVLSAGKSKALIRLNPQDDARWIEEGQAAGSWKLVKVEAGRILLGRAGQSLALSLYPAAATFQIEKDLFRALPPSSETRRKSE